MPSIRVEQTATSSLVYWRVMPLSLPQTDLESDSPCKTWFVVEVYVWVIAAVSPHILVCVEPHQLHNTSPSYHHVTQSPATSTFYIKNHHALSVLSPTEPYSLR